MPAKPGQYLLPGSSDFYCLDFSFLFAASTLLTIQLPVPLIFDMCTAPGGKSVFASKALQPELLVSNEVIGKRTGMLISNLKHCHISPSIVLSKDSSIVANMILNSSQLVIIDAPCTSQSLLTKCGKAPGHFQPTAIGNSLFSRLSIPSSLLFLVIGCGSKRD